MSSLPLTGRTPDAIRTAAEAGLLVTDAGEDLSIAVEHLERGLEAQSLSGERIPVSVLDGSSRRWSRPSKVEDADRLAGDLATTFVPPPGRRRR